jgi:hypothetical protein
MQHVADLDMAALDALEASCSTWSQPIATAPVGPSPLASAVLTPQEHQNATSLETICANLFGILGDPSLLAEPPPPTPACLPNPPSPPRPSVGPEPIDPLSPSPAPPWKKARASPLPERTSPLQEPSWDSHPNPWSQEFFNSHDDGGGWCSAHPNLAAALGAGASASASAPWPEEARLPRFGPVSGETPEEAAARKARNKQTRKRGGKHQDFFYHRYGKDKGGGGKGSGDKGGGSSGGSGTQGLG